MLESRIRLLLLLPLAPLAVYGAAAAIPPPPTSASVTRDSGHQARIDYTRPSEPRVVGTGFVEAFTLDGDALVVNDVDERFSKPGCEGLPEPVLLRLPLDGGRREPLGTADGDPLQGHFLRTSGGRVAVVEDCEEYLGRIFVAQEASEGWLSQVVQVPEEEGRWPEAADMVVWSASPTHLLAATVSGTDARSQPTEFAVVRIAVANGAVKEVFRARHAIYRVGQFPDGRIVSAGDGTVRIHDEHGETTREFAGEGFAIGPDGSLAIFAEGLTVVPPSGGPARVLVEPEAGVSVIQVRWSPGAEALAFIRRGDRGGDESVGVVTRDGTLTELARMAAWGLAFSPDGRLLAFSQFPPEPENPAEAVVFRFDN